MKLIVNPLDGNEKFEVEVTKVLTGGINDYLIAHKKFRAFQFDCYDRPKHYHSENLLIIHFSGYLIGRGKHKTIECSIQVIK